jgi:four helix bundle protein
MSQADDLQARVEEFASRTLEFCDTITPSSKTNRLIDQLVGSAGGTAANYRAARRARSHAEFTSKVGIVVEEIDEAEFWLASAARRKLGDTSVPPTLLAEASELVRILGRTAATARRNERIRQSSRRQRFSVQSPNNPITK